MLSQLERAIRNRKRQTHNDLENQN
jgi:hypothetical protein